MTKQEFFDKLQKATKIYLVGSYLSSNLDALKHKLESIANLKNINLNDNSIRHLVKTGNTKVYFKESELDIKGMKFLGIGEFIIAFDNKTAVVYGLENNKLTAKGEDEALMTDEALAEALDVYLESKDAYSTVRTVGNSLRVSVYRSQDQGGDEEILSLKLPNTTQARQEVLEDIINGKYNLNKSSHTAGNEIDLEALEDKLDEILSKKLDGSSYVTKMNNTKVIIYFYDKDNLRYFRYVGSVYPELEKDILSVASNIDASFGDRTIFNEKTLPNLIRQPKGEDK